MWHQPVWNPVLTSWPPSSHRPSTDHWSCAKSPHDSSTPPSSPYQRNPILLDLMNTDLWPWNHLKDWFWLIWKTSLDPLQFAYRANRSVDDAVIMVLHLDRPRTYARILFVDFSSTFNTIIPSLLQPKLTQLSVPTSVCQWINSSHKFSSSTRMISTSAPQGYVLSPLHI